MAELSPSQVDTLLEQCILALETGDQAKVDAVMAGNATAAPHLRERLDQLSALGILQAPQRSPAIPDQLGEFRLLRQIGRGGMGVVYLAEQTALQRHVALKLVHPEQLFFRGARERFRREVLAVARLQHPGIVPILTCGEACGIPFYAMELVQGASLAEVLGELAGTAPAALDGPTLRAALQRAMAKKHELAAVQDAHVFQGSWTNVCCRLAHAAAEALQHAHEQRVLHRDVKPSNLLLTVTGELRVIDFGLASAEGEQKITRSGATFGSVPYMAPEQVRGEVGKINVRTDVYALGVTLYELLTLTLPHGCGSGSTRERILAGHVEPPARRNAQVHPDAEAICLMAMDLDPARRYQTASALAADLRAFLDHRSVRARRPSLLLRTRRWARRNPTRAATAVVLFLALVPGPLVFAAQQSAAAERIQTALDEAGRQRGIAETNLEEAQAQQQAAERSLDQALNAVDLMLLRTAQTRLADVPRTAKLRRQLLQDAVDFHEQLVSSLGTATDGQRAREERARSQSRLGSLHIDLGDLSQALPLLQAAAASLAQLLPTSSRRDRLREELAGCQADLARALGQADRVVEQETALRWALALFDDLAAQSGNARHFENAIDAQLGIAMSLGRQHRMDEAHAMLDAVDQRLDPEAAGGLPAKKRALLWAEAADHRGVLFAAAGETTSSLASFEAALRRLDTVPAEQAGEPEVSAARVGILERLGLMSHQRRQWDKAAPWLDQAAAQYERLAAQEPELPNWRFRLARMLGTRAANQRMLGDSRATLVDHDRAITLLQTVVQEAPEQWQFRRSLAVAFAERADWHEAQADHGQALLDFEHAEHEFEACLAQRADDEQSKGNFVAALANHARVLARDNDLGTARTLMQRALDLARSRTGPQSERNLVEMLMQASDFAVRDDDAAMSMALMDEASERAEALFQAQPEDTARQTTAAMTALNHGTNCLTLHQHSKAIMIWTAALPVVRSAATASPFGKQLLSVLLLRLADVHLRQGAIEKAREWFAAAITETGVTATQLDAFPELSALFASTEFKDLLPRGDDGK